ncbi:MAG: Uma2 family endonuclease [Candidatus Poribacteria bacterium]|nr:Uma2 family endonuclease [Candidatus Poribacteria bacterium]
MATKGAQTFLTPEEYITLERKAIPDADTVRSEYVNGKIIGMSSTNLSHNLITGNIAAELHTQLKSSRCAVLMNEMRVSIPSAKCYFYPDVVVTCDEPRFEDDVFDIFLNPIVIVEVLSPTTEAYDRGEKFSHYRQIEFLQEYIVVSQDKVNVERYLRKPDEWSITFFQELTQQVTLTSIECELPLQEIYERVTFHE